MSHEPGEALAPLEQPPRRAFLLYGRRLAVTISIALLAAGTCMSLLLAQQFADLRVVFLICSVFSIVAHLVSELVLPPIDTASSPLPDIGNESGTAIVENRDGALSILQMQLVATCDGSRRFHGWGLDE